MTDTKISDVAILGGGISGLTAGFLLARGGRSVMVLERSERAGGAIQTWRSEDGFLFELGPNTVLNNAFEIDELCQKARMMEDRLGARTAARKRFVVKGGKLVPLPGGPVAFLRTPLFSWRAKLRLLREPFISRAEPGSEESIAQFARRRLGEEFLQYAVGPFVSGVYAGDPERLSVRHATAKIHALEERYGSLMRGAIAKRKGPAPAGGLFSFRDGLEALPARLASELGDAWTPGVRVSSVTRAGSVYRLRLESGQQGSELQARSVISALPAASAASVLEPLGGEFPARIRELPQADVAIVCLGFRRDQVGHPLDGFGFLAPATENRHVLGCLFPSSMFPGRAPQNHVALTVFVGGALHPERVAAEPGDIVERSLDDLRPLLGIEGDPVLWHVKAWQPAIPQYVIGHGANKEAAEVFEAAHRGVFISGNLLHGVSVADCIRNATQLVPRVEEYLARPA